MAKLKNFHVCVKSNGVPLVACGRAAPRKELLISYGSGRIIQAGRKPMKIDPSRIRYLFIPFALWLLIFLSSCDWRPYVQKSYESRIGQKSVVSKDEAVVEYETGLLMNYDKSKRDAVIRKLYYIGIADSALQFLWQRYDLSTFSQTTDRTLEKSPVTLYLQPFPFKADIHGFSLLIHDADSSHITYTLLSAEPNDLPDTTIVKKPIR